MVRNPLFLITRTVDDFSYRDQNLKDLKATAHKNLAIDVLVKFCLIVATTFIAFSILAIMKRYHFEESTADKFLLATLLLLAVQGGFSVRSFARYDKVIRRLESGWRPPSHDED